MKIDHSLISVLQQQTLVSFQFHGGISTLKQFIYAFEHIATNLRHLISLILKKQAVCKNVPLGFNLMNRTSVQLNSVSVSRAASQQR